MEPMTSALTRAVERLTAQTDGQAAAVKEAVETANAATARSTELVAALQREFDRAATDNRATLEAATDTIKAMANMLDELKTSSSTYVEVLELLLEKTDSTMRTFTDVLVRTGVEAATQTEGLREVLPAIEASAHAIAMAAERISVVLDDVRTLRPAPKREAVD
jgi:DNA repair exonuclease SbcCD ATPase subunit